jgi:hypothetical protein
MIRLLLVNLTPESEWVVWRAAQQAWGRCLCMQFVPNIETALNLLCQEIPSENIAWPTLVMLAIGAYGDWDPALIEQLRNALAQHDIPLVGLADTSLALERLRARHAPLDAMMLNPVQPDSLRELTLSLHLDKSLDCSTRSTAMVQRNHQQAAADGLRNAPVAASG